MRRRVVSYVGYRLSPSQALSRARLVTRLLFTPSFSSSSARARCWSSALLAASETYRDSPGCLRRQAFEACHDVEIADERLAALQAGEPDGRAVHGDGEGALRLQRRAADRRGRRPRRGRPARRAGRSPGARRAGWRWPARRAGRRRRCASPPSPPTACPGADSSSRQDRIHAAVPAPVASSTGRRGGSGAGGPGPRRARPTPLCHAWLSRSSLFRLACRGSQPPPMIR